MRCIADYINHLRPVLQFRATKEASQSDGASRCNQRESNLNTHRKETLSDLTDSIRSSPPWRSHNLKLGDPSRVGVELNIDYWCRQSRIDFD